jgi:hypothetical protein
VPGSTDEQSPHDREIATAARNDMTLIHDTLVLLLPAKTLFPFEKRIAVSMKQLPECPAKYM